jgi:hypothetical protein
VRAAFPDPSPDAVGRAVDAFCRRELGAAVAAAEFLAAGVGLVHGLRLADGRRVVVKAHPPPTPARFLAAVHAVQRALVEQGFPAPAPLASPAPLGRGLAVAENLLDAGDVPDARRPAVRRAMAASLADLVRRCRRFVGLAGLGERAAQRDDGGLWPVPHDARFDFAATARGAEWIDDVAARARARRDRPMGDLVVGHHDWRAEHLRFAGGRPVAVYDWDSLGVTREPVLVGSVAHAFTADWRRPERRQFPSLAEALAFVREYEDARGSAFESAEREVVEAALAYAMGYTARCEHSDALSAFGRRRPAPPPSSPAVPPGSARAFLAANAAQLLRGAG